ncbi:Biotin synthase [Trichinella spiralis]|uniref:Biotin synthase n=1 Tax=Trichinella spiralis TaxID=6334 RepID=A0ABR3L490_TRISP
MTIESHTCTSELEGNSRNCSSSKVPLKQRQKVEVYAGRNGRWLKFVTTYVALPKLNKSIKFPRSGTGKYVARACFVNNALVVYLLHKVLFSGNTMRKIDAKIEQTRDNPGQLAEYA